MQLNISLKRKTSPSVKFTAALPFFFVSSAPAPAPFRAALSLLEDENRNGGDIGDAVYFIDKLCKCQRFRTFCVLFICNLHRVCVEDFEFPRFLLSFICVTLLEFVCCWSAVSEWVSVRLFITFQKMFADFDVWSEICSIWHKASNVLGARAYSLPRTFTFPVKIIKWNKL